jgi:methionyl-tRNA formyltransferase
LIRGTNPQPGATTTLRGQKLKIFDCELGVEIVSAQPGEIIEISDKGIAVAGQGGWLLIKRVQPQGQPKVRASEHALKAGLKAGGKFG